MLVEELRIAVSVKATQAVFDFDVEFVVNASYHTVLDWLSRANIGLSTMIDEHFGINIVEFMVRVSLHRRNRDDFLHT